MDAQPLRKGKERFDSSNNSGPKRVANFLGYSLLLTGCRKLVKTSKLSMVRSLLQRRWALYGRIMITASGGWLSRRLCIKGRGRGWHLVWSVKPRKHRSIRWRPTILHFPKLGKDGPIKPRGLMKDNRWSSLKTNQAVEIKMGWYPAIYYSLDSKSDKRAETPWKGVRPLRWLWGSTTAILHCPCKGVFFQYEKINFSSWY